MRVIEECFRRGLLLLGAGPLTIRLSPPLMIDEEQADFCRDTVRSYFRCLITAVRAFAPSEGPMPFPLFLHRLLHFWPPLRDLAMDYLRSLATGIVTTPLTDQRPAKSTSSPGTATSSSSSK